MRAFAHNVSVQPLVAMDSELVGVGPFTMKMIRLLIHWHPGLKQPPRYSRQPHCGYFIQKHFFPKYFGKIPRPNTEPFSTSVFWVAAVSFIGPAADIINTLICSECFGPRSSGVLFGARVVGRGEAVEALQGSPIATCFTKLPPPEKKQKHGLNRWSLTLEVKPPVFRSWFTNHHFLRKGL